MAIERKTPVVGLDILESGTTGWGLFTNNNFDLLDSALLSDRGRITALESTSAVLPLAIANRIAHNLLRNNVFSQGTVSAPEVATFWTGQFLNGASGSASRTNQTYLVGSHALRVSIANVNTSPSTQTRPYPGLNILDVDTLAPLATTDPIQLTNGFGYAFQTVNLSANTIYTLSAYGKAEIPNPTLGINVHWKVGVVFKDTGGAVIHSHFSGPQINRTNNVATDSFERVELTFTTPDLPIVTAETWIVTEGSLPAGIGSAWFDGIQLEQATRATSLDMFAMKDGDLLIDGDLVISGNLALQQENLVFDSNNVTFTGNVQFGDNILEDSLEVFTKSSIFHGPLTVEGSTTLGDDAINDILDVVANKTTFFDNGNVTNPQGGDVCIQGDLTVDGSTVLGNNTLEDTVTINALLVTASSSLSVVDDLDVGGYLEVKRGVILGSNDPTPSPFDSLTVNMQDGGSSFFGDVTLKDDLTVDGNVILGDTITDTVIINAGATTLNGSLQVTNALLVEGPTTFNIGSGSGDDFTIVASDYALTASGTANITTATLAVSGGLTLGAGNTASINSADVNFGTSGTPLTTFDVFAMSSTMSGTLDIGGNVSTDGNILAATGDTFLFGTAFSANPSGELTIGDESSLTVDTYNNTLRVFAGNIFFGDVGAQKKGNVQIGGSLSAAGDITLGSSTVEDTLNLTGNSINFEVGSGDLNIGGGFRNETYNPLSSDHGGITVDTHGNLAMDGKLTVKGPFDPTSIIITPQQADGYNVVDALVVTSPASSPTTTFRLTSEGTINAARGLVLGSGLIADINGANTTFGAISTPLDSFNVFATTTNLKSIVNIDGPLSAGDFSSDSATVNGNLSVTGSATISGSISSPGTSFAFGGAPATPTTFDVRANTITLGIDGGLVGNVIVGNDLSVRNDFNVGFPTEYNNVVNLNASSVNLDVGSIRPGSIELAGFRVGGGFQDNVFNGAILDHGGVTIDAYGNIYADGSVFQKGALGVESLVLTVPLGGIPTNSIFSIVNNNIGQGDTTFFLDGYGNVQSDGYIRSVDSLVDGALCLTGENLTNTLDGSGLKITAGAISTGISDILFKVFHLDTSVLYAEYPYGAATYSQVSERTLDIDDLGNLRTNGFLHTDNPGASNLSAYSVTVGDGVTTFGDFNAKGPVKAFADPIKAASDFLTARGVAGTIFVKSGTYQIANTGIILADGVSIVGEGDATVLDGSVFYGLAAFGISLYGQGALGLECGSNCRISNITMFNSLVGIRVGASKSNVRIDNVTVLNTNIGISVLGTDCKIENCRFVDTIAAGLAAPKGVVVAGDRNIIKNNRMTNTVDDAYGVELTITSEKNLVAENFLFLTGAGAIAVGDAATNTEIHTIT